MGHSMSDPLHGVYRTKEEVEEQKKRDPITRLADMLSNDGVIDAAALETLDGEVAAEVEDALRFAEESPEPALEALERDVLAD
jgi:pyruvate dehydrogenase E1 component alpha subunit